MTEPLDSLDYAKNLDKKDTLRHFRSEFYIPSNTIYLDGNSLGLLSKRAEHSLQEVLHSWKTLGIDGWTQGEHPWYYLSETLGEMSASLVGAEPNEVIVTGSTTTNLHQILSTFYQPEGHKNKILADELNFPSDIYALKSQLQLHGLQPETHLVQVKSRDGHTLHEDDIVSAMTEDIAFIVLPSVLYRSGQILDMEYLTREAHKRDILIAFDLCHSIGAVPHCLSKWNVDFAFWCNYKHLNGGPGSVASLYVNQEHFNTSPGLAGWFGSDKNKQFDMEHTMFPASDAGAYQIGTPHLLSAAPLYGSLSMFNEAGIENIRAKSLKMTEYFMELIDKQLHFYDFQIANPQVNEKRGAHIYLEHPEAARICKALKANHVIPDFRSPHGIRLAPVPLYNTYEEIWKTVQLLKRIMDEKLYKKFSNKRDVIA